MKKIILLFLLLISLLLLLKVTKVNASSWNENRIQKTYDEKIDGYNLNFIILYDKEKDIDCYITTPNWGGGLAMQCIKNSK